MDQLRDKNTIDWKRLDVATQEQKVYNMEIEIVTLVVKGSAKLTITTRCQDKEIFSREDRES